MEIIPEKNLFVNLSNKKKQRTKTVCPLCEFNFSYTDVYFTVSAEKSFTALHRL